MFGYFLWSILVILLNTAFCSRYEIVNRCSSLSAPNHGRLLGTCSNVQEQTCQFSCDRGYLLSGSSTRQCNSDGTWTGQQAQCIGTFLVGGGRYFQF